MTEASLVRIHRYPVKGLKPQALERVALTPGKPLPDDRRFAIVQSSPLAEGSGPADLPVASYVSLTRVERLAQLDVAYDAASGRLSLARSGKTVVTGDVTSPLGRTLISQFLAGFLKEQTQSPAKLVACAGAQYTDTWEDGFVSLNNLASIRDLERVMRQPIDPSRFRGNLYIDGLPAWAEFDWLDKEFMLGSVRLKARERIQRCAATNVDPLTANRDMNIPLALRRGFGHIDMGIYVEVIESGEVALGDSLRPPAS